MRYFPLQCMVPTQSGYVAIRLGSVMPVDEIRSSAKRGMGTKLCS